MYEGNSKANLCITSKKESEMQRAMADLEGSITSLSDRLGLLESRLIYVLIPMPTCKDEGIKAQSVISPLANQIDEQTYRIKKINLKVNDIIDQLAI